MPDEAKDSVARMRKIIAGLPIEERRRLSPLLEHLRIYDTINHAKARTLTGKSPSAVNGYLAQLVKLKILIPEGKNKGRTYRRASEKDEV